MGRLPFVAFAALVAVFFAPVLFAGETFFAVDNLQLYLPWSSGNPGFRPENQLITDPVNGLIYPAMSLLKSGFSEGAIALWNPFALLGVPQHPQSNPLDYLAYGLLSIPTAHDSLLALYLFATLAFTWLFLRELALRRSAAFLGSVAWGFDPYVMVWFEYEHCPLVAATVPAMLLCVELWRRTRRKTALLGLSTAAAFSLWSDNVQLTVYAWLLVGGWMLLRSMRRPLPLRSELLPMAAALTLSAIAAASVVTGGLFVIEGAHREPLAFTELYRHAGGMPWDYLRTLAFPDFYGSPLHRVDFTPALPEHKRLNYNELCVYVGVAPLLLAAASLGWWRRGPVAYFGLAAAFCVLGAAGSFVYFPISLLPGLNLASPTRILFAWGFCMSMLAALGLDNLLRADPGDHRRRWGLAAAGLVALAALAVALDVQSVRGLARALRHSLPAERLQELLAAARLAELPVPLVEHFAWGGLALAPERIAALVLAAALIAGLVYVRAARVREACGVAMVALTIVELASFGASYNTTAERSLVYPETPGIRFLKRDESQFRMAGFGRFFHGTLAPLGLQDLGGFVSFLPTRSGEMLLAAQVPGLIASEVFGWDAAPPGGLRRHVDHVRAGSTLLDLLNLKYILAAPGTAPRGARKGSLELVYDNEIRIFRNADVFPRAFFVPRYELAADRVAAYRALLRWRAEDFRGRILLEAPPPPAFRDLEEVGARRRTGAAVVVSSYRVNDVALEVDAPERGFVVLADAWFPAWTAEVNGAEVEVLRANYGLRAVAVEAGASKVEFSLRPRLLEVGLAVSAASWFAFAGAWLVVLWCRFAPGMRKRSS